MYTQGNQYGDDEIYSIKLEARSRFFYFDLKKSSNGFFVKISEKSPKAGRSTIMFDIEDIDSFIKNLEEMKKKADELSI